MQRDPALRRLSWNLSLKLALALGLVSPMWVAAEKAQQPSRAQPYEVGAPVQADTSEDAAQAFEVAAHELEGIAVPIYGTSVADPNNDGKRLRHLPPDDIRSQLEAARLSAEDWQRLAVYQYSHGWLLVPRHWQLQSGKVGTNGSAAWAFAAPDASGWLRYTHSGACAGCAQGAAAPFFPKALEEARDNGLIHSEGTDVPIDTSQPAPHLVGYRAEKKDRRIEGVVHYAEDKPLPHWHVEVVLPIERQALARPMLKPFLK